MKNTSLCYIERGRDYLMLHRVKKLADEIKGIGARPGIWLRLLHNRDKSLTKDMRLCKNGKYRYLDPTHPEVQKFIRADIERIRDWGYELMKHDFSTFDIHDRVNYSVVKSALKINEDKTLVKLKLSVDTKFGSVMDYFEIFMQRMILCRKAAEKLGLQFKLIINEQQLI